MPIERERPTASDHGSVSESFQEPVWQERDENSDGGLGRGWENDHSLQAETGRDRDDDPYNWYG